MSQDTSDITIYCGTDFFNKLMSHPLMVISNAFWKAAQIFPNSRTRVYSTKKGSKKVFKVTNLDTSEVRYVKRTIKIPNGTEFCQIFRED